MLYEPLLREAEVEEKGQSKRPEPVAEEDRAGWLSQMAFGWLTPTIRHGYRRRLEPVDALNVPQRYSHQQNFAAFRVAWARNAHRRHARGAFSSRVSHSVWCVVGRHFAVSILAIMLALARLSAPRRLARAVAPRACTSVAPVGTIQNEHAVSYPVPPLSPARLHAATGAQGGHPVPRVQV